MKKRILSLLSLCLVFVMLCAVLFTFAGCGDKEDSADDNGIYYRYKSGAINKDVFIEIDGNKWYGQLDGIRVTGTCKISGGKLSLLYTVGSNPTVDRELGSIGKDGEDVELYAGTIGNGAIELRVVLGETQSSSVLLYRDGVIPGGDGLPNGLGNAGNGGIGDTGATSADNTQSSGRPAGNLDGTYTAEDGSEVLTLQNGRWSVTGESYQFDGDYELDGDEITLYMETNGVNTPLLVGTVSGNVITFNGLRYVK